MCFVSGLQFKYPVGVVLSISEEGHSLVGFLGGGGVWIEALPGKGAWDGTFYPNISDSLDICMSGAGVMFPTTYSILNIYAPNTICKRNTTKA